MVHNTLTGEQLGPEALGSPSPKSEIHAATAGARDREKVWLAERGMLQMVRNGDINYHAVIQRSVNLSPGVPVHGADPLRQMKTSIVVFTTLVSRAAMEGGLSPEVAYALGDSYLQSVEDCRDSGELAALATAMYHDFIYRVHHLRSNPGYSHAIQKCCDYIELSLDRKIRVSDLAALVGYTEYYLTEKFKKETGVPVSQYIRFAKASTRSTISSRALRPSRAAAPQNTESSTAEPFPAAKRKRPARMGRTLELCSNVICRACGLKPDPA